MPDQTELELARFWDALDTDPTGKTPVDPSLAEVVRVFTDSSDSAPDPDPMFVTQLWEDLMNAHATAVALPQPAMSGIPTNATRSANRPIALPGAPLKRRKLALIAAALLIAVIGGIASISLFDRGDQSHTAGPAIQAPSTPSPEASQDTETVFEVTLPADVVPADSLGTWFLLSRDTIPANSVTTRTSTGNTCCPGANLFYVLEGSVRVESTGPAQVIRHDEGGAIENVAAGELADVGPGDLVIFRNVDGQTWTTGPAKVEVIDQSLVSGDSSGPMPTGWANHGYSSDYHPLNLPAGPYLLTLRHVRVDSDTTFELPEDGVQQLALLDEGKALVGTGSDGVINVTAVKEPSILFMLTLSTTPEGLGTPIAGMNAPGPASPTPWRAVS